MLIDTHCHISIEDYDDIDKIINDDFKVVDKIIISGCSKESIYESLEIADKYDNIFVTIGYHPDQVDVYSDSDLIELEQLIKNKHVVGIGEIGLDYHYDKNTKDRQIELFEKQLEIAEKNHLPVVIHSRDATEDTINTLKKYKVKGVIHAFSGSIEVSDIYIKMGFLLGIGGVVTFKNSKLYKVIEEKGFAEVRFWYSYRSKYEGRFYNFGHVDEILNKTPVTPEPGTNKAQEGFDLFWEAVEAE